MNFSGEQFSGFSFSLSISNRHLTVERICFTMLSDSVGEQRDKYSDFKCQTDSS